MTGRRTWLAGLTLVASAGVAIGVAYGQGQAPGPPQPARDTPAQRTAAEPPTGAISGRVLAADTKRPLKRARVSITAAELPGGRAVLSDDMGVFHLGELPAGRYSLSVSKSGYVSLAYGQRRPLQPGTPLQLADGQQLADVEVALPRGSVITGHVYDEGGDPMPGVLVRALRYQYQQGERRLASAGTSQTNDLGEYRVWGLNPGDYYVDAQSRVNLPFNLPAGRGRGAAVVGGPGAAIQGLVGAIAGSNVASLFDPNDENQKAYAPTYYPGVAAITEAQAVRLGLSQTASDIDFNLQLVRVAHVSGRVVNPDGSPTTAGNVTMLTEQVIAGGGNQLGVNYGGRISADGSFTIGNVPPGRYLLRARGNNAEWPQYASQPVTVAGADITDLTVMVAEGATINGTVEFTPAATALPNLDQVRVSSVGLEPGVPNSQARIEKDNSFKIVAVAAGQHLIRANGQLRGWSLKSVVYEGRDITDTPIDLRSGQAIKGVTVTFTDAVNEINGALTTEQGVPVTDFTVVAFPTDATLWGPQSRHIATGRPDQTGHFRIRGLPQGTYYLTAVDPTEQGEWNEPSYLEDHRAGAAQVSLGEGETKTQDFKIRTQ